MLPAGTAPSSLPTNSMSLNSDAMDEDTLLEDDQAAASHSSSSVAGLASCSDTLVNDYIFSALPYYECDSGGLRDAYSFSFTSTPKAILSRVILMSVWVIVHFAGWIIVLLQTRPVRTGADAPGVALARRCHEQMRVHGRTCFVSAWR